MCVESRPCRLLYVCTACRMVSKASGWVTSTVMSSAYARTGEFRVLPLMWMRVVCLLRFAVEGAVRVRKAPCLKGNLVLPRSGWVSAPSVFHWSIWKPLRRRTSCVFVQCTDDLYRICGVYETGNGVIFCRRHPQNPAWARRGAFLYFQNMWLHLETLLQHPRWCSLDCTELTTAEVLLHYRTQTSCHDAGKEFVPVVKRVIER